MNGDIGFKPVPPFIFRRCFVNKNIIDKMDLGLGKNLILNLVVIITFTNFDK